MRIAQIAPLYESVPPKLYGGTERVVSYLTEELIRQGHEVTLFASGDSVTTANLVPCCREALRLSPRCVDHLACHVVMLEQVYRRADEFDVLHFHVDYLHYPWARRHRCTHLTTLHGRLDIPELPDLYREFPEPPLVSISDAQRSPLPWLNWQATVHHGLPPNLFQSQPKQGDYLAFLGRISPEKRVDRAIEIACKTGIPLRIAAKVDRADRDYFEQAIKPLLDHPLIDFIGEVGGADKEALLANAYALLFPVDWPEPFGLVMIEAMACGTPVIAWRCGSVPEVIDHGVSGFIVESMDEAIEAVEQVRLLSRAGCRRTFERRFTDRRMARDYLNLYRRLIDRPEDSDTVLPLRQIAI